MLEIYTNGTYAKTGLRWHTNKHHYKQSQMPYLTSPCRRARQNTHKKSSFGSPNSESGRQSYAFRKIMKWVGLKQEKRSVGRPQTMPKHCQTLSKASLHTIGPKGRSVCTNVGHMGINRWPKTSPNVASKPNHLHQLPTCCHAPQMISKIHFKSVLWRFHPMVAKEHHADR
jgi:hypothetical protein